MIRTYFGKRNKLNSLLVVRAADVVGANAAVRLNRLTIYQETPRYVKDFSEKQIFLYSPHTHLHKHTFPKQLLHALAPSLSLY